MMLCSCKDYFEDNNDGKRQFDVIELGRVSCLGWTSCFVDGFFLVLQTPMCLQQALLIPVTIVYSGSQTVWVWVGGQLRLYRGFQSCAITAAVGIG